MALFPAFAEVESNRVENSSKGFRSFIEHVLISLIFSPQYAYLSNMLSNKLADICRRSLVNVALQNPYPYPVILSLL